MMCKQGLSCNIKFYSHRKEGKPEKKTNGRGQPGFGNVCLFFKRVGRAYDMVLKNQQVWSELILLTCLYHTWHLGDFFFFFKLG